MSTNNGKSSSNFPRYYTLSSFLKEEPLSIRSVKDKGSFVVLFDSVNFEPDWHAGLNLFLFSILMSEIRLLSGNIWLCSAIHATWHISAGILFGTSVLGFSETNLFFGSVPTTSAQWLTGGTFGIERSNIHCCCSPRLFLLSLGITASNLKTCIVRLRTINSANIPLCDAIKKAAI